MLNKCLKQDFVSITLLVILPPILKVVGNLFQVFHLDGSVWFSYRMIVRL